MSRMSSTGGFALGMVILGAVSIAAVPVFVATAGAAGFAAIVIGQTVGALGAILITYGWNYGGPVAIARGDAGARETEYLESLKVRLLLTPGVAVAGCLVAWALAPSHTALAVWGCLSMLGVGLSASWYHVGAQTPWHLLGLETGPRAVSTLVAVGLMLAGATATVALMVQTVGILLAFGLSSLWILKESRTRSHALRPARDLMLMHRHGVASAMLVGIYLGAPLVVLRYVLPVQALAAFAVLDRVQRQIYVAATPFAKAIQGWVPSGPEGSLLVRARKAALVGAGLGLAMTLGFALLGPPFVGLLGGETVEVPWTATVAMAGVIGLSFVDSVLGQAVLAPLGMMSRLARVTALGSIVGIGLVVILGWQFGLTGGVLGMLGGLVVRVVWLALAARRHGAASAARTAASA